MSFKFVNYGTFTGPNSFSGDYNYDALSQEGFWHTDSPEDTSFKLTDLAMVLFNNNANYVGFYCNGTATQIMTLAHSQGEIPTFRIQSRNTIVSGQVIVNDKIICNGPIFANATMTLTGVGDVASNINLAKALPAKPFDIPHPSKKGQRLRHVSLEGPEIGVYYRGKLQDTNTITLPDYWENLIDQESITVNLTPVGSYQELFVEKIEWGKNIIVKNREGGPISCHYTVYAERKDMEKLIVEYEGTSPKDYPGQDWLNLRSES